MADRTTTTERTKALAGSFEERALRLQRALKDAELLPGGDVWVTDSFDTSLVACVWVVTATEDGYNEYERHYYEVQISAEDGDTIEFGEVKEVDKVQGPETLVDVKAAGVGARRTKVRSPFVVKSLTPADDEIGGWDAVGSFSVFDHEDHSKDIVRKGSTKDSTAVHLPKILDHHGVTVGQATKAAEVGNEFEVHFRIYPTRAGEDLSKLMQPIETDLGLHAPVEQGSIGFSPLEGGAKRRNGGGWEYTKLWIWEVSPVTFGDNDATQVGLKSAGDLDELPTSELLVYAADTMRLALDGPQGLKALHRRRMDDDRDLTDEHWKAAEGLMVTAAETALGLLELEGRAGKSVSNSHMRHMRAIIEGLAELIHGRAAEATPEPETEETEDPAEGKAKAAPGGQAPRSEDLRERDLALASLGLAHLMETN